MKTETKQKLNLIKKNADKLTNLTFYYNGIPLAIDKGMKDFLNIFDKIKDSYLAGVEKDVKGHMKQLDFISNAIKSKELNPEDVEHKPLMLVYFCNIYFLLFGGFIQEDDYFGITAIYKDSDFVIYIV